MSKKCTACQLRTIGTGKGQTFNDREDARQHDLCVPCLEEAYWENAHNDYDHEGIRTTEGTEGLADEMGYALDDCWTCHPELDRSQNTPAERAGTSRAGMKINVPLKATGKEKAGVVKELLGGKVTSRNGLVTLKVEVAGGELKLVWDAQGRYQYDLSSFATEGTARRVRNVAQALRIAK